MEVHSMTTHGICPRAKLWWYGITKDLTQQAASHQECLTCHKIRVDALLCCMGHSCVSLSLFLWNPCSLTQQQFFLSTPQMTNLDKVIRNVSGVAKCPYSPHDNNTAIMSTLGNLYSASVTDFLGRDAAISRSMGPAKFLRTVQYNSRWLNGELQVTNKWWMVRQCSFLMENDSVIRLNKNNNKQKHPGRRERKSPWPWTVLMFDSRDSIERCGMGWERSVGSDTCWMSFQQWTSLLLSFHTVTRRSVCQTVWRKQARDAKQLMAIPFCLLRKKYIWRVLGGGLRFGVHRSCVSIWTSLF